MPEELALAAVGIGAVGYVANKLFGSTLDTIGSDLNSAYQKGRDKLLNKAAAKVSDPNDGKIPNLRVARDVLWNGAITDNEICAEYFGGILAASRSEDGTDDSALHYLDVIKSLSAKQLHLHYCIYRALQQQFLAAGAHVNVGQQSELAVRKVFMPALELLEIGLRPQNDLAVLHRTGILASYELTNAPLAPAGNLPYAWFTPTTFGCMLYAVAFNKFDAWNSFSTSDFGTLEGIKTSSLPAQSLEELLKLTNNEAVPAGAPAP